MIHIAMTVTMLAHASSLASEMHAGMVQPVRKNQRLGSQHLLVENSLKNSGIGLKA